MSRVTALATTANAVIVGTSMNVVTNAAGAREGARASATSVTGSVNSVSSARCSGGYV